MATAAKNATTPPPVQGAAVSRPGCEPRSTEGGPLLTVIVPVFNEAATVGELLRRVVAADCHTQVVVVDDGSTDGTAAALEAWIGHPQIEVLAHWRNRGKGAAIRTGLKRARGRYTIIQDGDLEYNPQDYPRLLGPLLSGEADVVYGSRYLHSPSPQTSPAGGEGDAWRPSPAGGAGGSGRRLFRWGISVLNFGVRWWYGVRLTDEATCYKVFPTAALRALDLECRGFEFCPEVTAKACRMGLRIVEVPIRYAARTVQAGKKIRWTDGLTALATLWKWRNWRPAAVPAGGGCRQIQRSDGHRLPERVKPPPVAAPHRDHRSRVCT